VHDRRLCVLVVDDEPLNRDLLRRTLKREFEIVEAEDARQALDVLATRDDVALVLSDQAMPGQSGTELARVIQAGQRPVMVVLLTGYDHDPEVLAAAAAGWVAAVVPKPWQAPMLRQLIARLLDRGAA
jgi:CheY-like chemotaxis protein